ncbi:MAG: ACP S-malonyltransferase [Nitrospirota bacterium]
MNICFVFPGQGSQHVGMGKDIHDAFSAAREIFDQASETLRYDVASLCFSGPAEELNRTFRTQPCILTVSIAIHKVLDGKGVRPAVVAGHSLGEYSALVAAEAMSFADALKLTEKRGQFMQDAVPEGKGLMAAILGMDRSRLEAICRNIKSGYVSPANYNCPGQVVIAGEKEAVEEAIELCRSSGAKRAVALPVSVPSHCSLMEGASKKLADILDTIPMKRPVIPFINNADASFLNDALAVKTSLTKQLNSPLLWEEMIQRIADSGVTTFLEAGPGKVLSGLIRRILPEAGVYHVEDGKSLENTLRHIG